MGRMQSQLPSLLLLIIGGRFQSWGMIGLQQRGLRFFWSYLVKLRGGNEISCIRDVNMSSEKWMSLFLSKNELRKYERIIVKKNLGAVKVLLRSIKMGFTNQFVLQCRMECSLLLVEKSFIFHWGRIHGTHCPHPIVSLVMETCAECSKTSLHVFSLLQNCKLFYKSRRHKMS